MHSHRERPDPTGRQLARLPRPTAWGACWAVLGGSGARVCHLSGREECTPQCGPGTAPAGGLGGAQAPALCSTSL